MHNIILQIIEKTKLELQKKKTSLSEVKSQATLVPTKDPGLFKRQLVLKNSIAVIAEIKLASPTHPSLGTKEDMLSRVIVYQKAGASALSVVTEKYFFNGSIDYIAEIKQHVSLP